jgi:hypothetical protein
VCVKMCRWGDDFCPARKYAAIDMWSAGHGIHPPIAPSRHKRGEA